MEHIWHQEQFGEPWFTYPNLYSRFVREIPDEGCIVEVGCWKGKSTAYLAVEVINSGKNIKVHAVDTWLGSINEVYHMQDVHVKSDTLYDLFLNNIKPCGDVVTPIRKTSVQASSLYQDSSLDVVFIDASHDYDSVKQDIIHWLPKVKPGGYLAGHDYLWEGVGRAVNELISPVESTELCWVYRKP